jgi:hypothetical protein
MNNKTEFIFFVGLSIAFGLSLKSVIDSFIFDTLEPMIIILFPRDKRYDRTKQFIHFIANIISFIIIIIIIIYTLKNIN